MAAGDMVNDLVAAVRTADCQRLLVSFNSYENPAFREGGMPFQTRFESYARLSRFDANVIWLSERHYSWYTGFERRIVDALIGFIGRNAISRVTLMGSSAGGFAALRLGPTLNRLLHQRNIGPVTIDSIAINPQTGFRPELIERVRSEMRKVDWPERHLGTNPPLLNMESFRADRVYHPVCDLRDVIQSHGFGDFRAYVFYDRLNPIDRTFAEDLAQFPQVAFTSMGWGAAHGAGSIRLMQDPKLSAMIDAIIGAPRTESTVPLVEFPVCDVAAATAA